MGRISRDRFSRRVRRVHSEPRPAAARPLLSRAARNVARDASDGCVIDGEIVIATPHGLDFDALQLRLHPAASRVAKLAKETPASFVAFDVLAVDGRNVMSAAQTQRRALLEQHFARSQSRRCYLTPMTRDRAIALRSGWSTSKERGSTA